MGQDRICAFCNKEIEDQALKAKNRLYHENTCFKCQVCSKDLKNVGVFSKEDGVLYCEADYKAKFVPKCAKCHDYIMEVRLNDPLLSSHPRFYTYKSILMIIKQSPK